MFDYIEFFYNPQRKHVRNGMPSPIAFEQRQKLKLQSVWETRGHSHTGHPVFGTNTGGTKVWTAAYLPFGGVHTTTGTAINLRFPGQWFQAESGLHQNWMRDYDPTTGRYLQADPLGLVDGASVYGYVRQSPMMLTDPTGECPWCVAAGAGVVAGAAIDIAYQLYVNDWRIECINWWEVGASAFVGGATSSFGAAGYAGRYGREWASKSGNWRWAPWGNRTGHKYGKWPHYHRRGAGPGQGVKRHRPFEPKKTDTGWWDRF